MLSKPQPIKYLNYLVEKVYAKMPLKNVLIVPFVLQICGSIGLVSYLLLTIILCICAFLLAAQLGILIASWVIKPIMQLNASANKIAAGKWQQIVEIERDDELGELAKSFNSMAKQLQEYFAALEAKHTEMKILNEALSDSQNRLIQFLEAIPVGVFISNAKGNPYYINQIAKQILGSRSSSRSHWGTIGRSLSSLSFWHRGTLF